MPGVRPGPDRGNRSRRGRLRRILPAVTAYWPIPEGVRVLKDGGWRVGGFPVVHAPSLRHLKSRLVFEDDGAFVVEGSQRMPVVVEGPPLEVQSVVLDREQGEARVVLDDGSEEALVEANLNWETGRFECPVRGGRARALFSRGAHQLLLQHFTEEDGRFYLRVGARQVPIRT